MNAIQAKGRSNWGVGGAAAAGGRVQGATKWIF